MKKGKQMKRNMIIFKHMIEDLKLMNKWIIIATVNKILQYIIKYYKITKFCNVLALLAKAVLKRNWNAKCYWKPFLTSSLCVGYFFSYLCKVWSPRVCLGEISFIAIQNFSFFFVFPFLISNDSLIFRLWYCCLVDKGLGFIQLNCLWHSKQCSVAPELFHSLKLSCWCFMVLVMSFLLVSLIYRALQVQPYW